MRIEDIEESQGYFTTTVALVTSKNRDIVNVMSAEWSLRVSLEPFLMAVFVGYERETIKNSLQNTFWEECIAAPFLLVFQEITKYTGPKVIG